MFCALKIRKAKVGMLLPRLRANLGRQTQIASVRAFNRLYTRVIGTLREGLLNSEYSLSEARVLFQLATRHESTAREIARDLDLDAGYLSRILRKFECAGLLSRKASG
jgi:DNA-binding MarR family transcriptional regulator